MNSVATEPMGRKLDDLVSLALALAVTALFVGLTVASWPEPFHIRQFEFQVENPFAALGVTFNKRVAYNLTKG